MILLVASLHAQELDVVVDPEGVRLDVRSSAEDLSWCQQERALFTWDGGWCEAVPPGCPGMVARCAAPPTDSWWDRLLDQLDAWRDPDEPPPVDLHLPDPRQAIVVLFVAVVVVALAWVILALRRRPAAPAPAGEAAEPGFEAPSVQDAGDGPFAVADAAARAGRFEEALMLLRGLAIEALVRRGVVRQDPSRTDREVDAWIRDRPEREPWRVVMLAVERVRYARRPGDAALFDRVRDATVRLLGMALLLLWAAPAHAGPTSHDLLVHFADDRLVEDLGSGAPIEPGALVVLPDGLAADGDPDALLEAVQGGAFLLVVSARDDAGGALQPYLPTERLSAGVVEPTGWYSAPGAGPVRTPLVTVGGLWAVPTLPDALVLAKAGERPVAVATPVGAGLIVVVGIPSFLEDASLLHEANHGFVEAIAQWADPTVVVMPLEDEAPSAVAIFQRAGLGPFLLHGLLLVLVAAWWRGRPFATPIEPVAARRRDFTAHVQAVARLNRHAGAVRRASAALSAWTLHRLRARLRLDGASLVRVVAARTGLAEPVVANALTDAERCAADPDGAANPDELPLLETLWQISTRTLPSRTSPPSPSASDGSKPPSTGS